MTPAIMRGWIGGCDPPSPRLRRAGRTSNRLYRKNELKAELGELYHANGASGEYDPGAPGDRLVGESQLI